MASNVPSYLRTYRRRSGLTQAEVAFLLGTTSGAKMSRYERLSRRPNLQTALGLQAIFGLATKEILPRLFVAVERRIIARAHLLSRQLKQRADSSRTRRKLTFLSAFIAQRESGTRPHL
jgi:transcriptional regulator with XRE-family HTH domain